MLGLTSYLRSHIKARDLRQYTDLCDLPSNALVCSLLSVVRGARCSCVARRLDEISIEMSYFVFLSRIAGAYRLAVGCE